MSIALKQYVYFNPTSTENEIDGASFLELTETDIKEIVKPLGIVKKILRLKRKVSAPTDRPTCIVTRGNSCTGIITAIGFAIRKKALTPELPQRVF